MTEDCDLTGSEVVWDLYSGTGTMAIGLARAARKVIGFELLQASVSDAQTNAGLNGVDNCEFVLGDLKDLLRSSSFANNYDLPHVVVTDPPRAGMHPSVVDQLLALEPPRIVYVSCNPATLARDFTCVIVEVLIITFKKAVIETVGF